jgi:protein subunit release factor A
VDELEKEIARLEQRQKELTTELENPDTYQQPGRAVAVNRELSGVAEDLTVATARWEQAAAKLSELTESSNQVVIADTSSA